MKLRLGIKQVGRIVFGRVLEQSGCMRNLRLATDKSNKQVHGISTVGDGPRFACVDVVNILCVRGDRGAKDNDWFAFAFDDKSAATEAVEDIKAFVDEINRNEPADPEDCGLEVIE